MQAEIPVILVDRAIVGEAGTQLASCTCTPYFGPILLQTITALVEGEEVAPAIVNPDTLYTKDNVDVSVGF